MNRQSNTPSVLTQYDHAAQFLDEFVPTNSITNYDLEQFEILVQLHEKVRRSRGKFRDLKPQLSSTLAEMKNQLRSTQSDDIFAWPFFEERIALSNKSDDIGELIRESVFNASMAQDLCSLLNIASRAVLFRCLDGMVDHMQRWEKPKHDKGECYVTFAPLGSSEANREKLQAISVVNAWLGTHNQHSVLTLQDDDTLRLEFVGLPPSIAHMEYRLPALLDLKPYLERLFEVPVSVHYWLEPAKVTPVANEYDEGVILPSLSRDIRAKSPDGVVMHNSVDDEQLCREYIVEERLLDAITLNVKKIHWTGPHSNEASYRRVKKLPWHATRAEIAFAKAKILNDRRYFDCCAGCGRWDLVDFMHQEACCQSCAEGELGVCY